MNPMQSPNTGPGCKDFGIQKQDSYTKLRTPSQERGCTGKTNLGRNYVVQANRLAKKHGKKFGVYRCPHCGGTHITTKLQNAELYSALLYTTE